MRVADYIFNRLKFLGTDTVFTVTGRGALFLTDALAKVDNVDAICCHHEQSVGYATIAYSDLAENQKLGVGLVSTGCASTNVITPVLSAWQDNIPCLFISGQNILQETTNYTGKSIRTYGQQEADIVPIVASITKYARMIHSAEEIIEVLDKAIIEAISGRKGPVWIDVPLCLQSAIIEVTTTDIERELNLPSPTAPKLEDISYTFDLLNQSKRPVFMIGSGIKSSGSEKLFSRIVEKTDIPVVYAHSACDSYPLENTLSIGSIGAMGCSRAGNFTIQNSDLVIVLGNRLSSYTTGVDFHKFAREAKIVVIDIDPEEHSKNALKIDKFVLSDVKVFLEKLEIKLDEYSKKRDWTKKVISWKETFKGIDPAFSNSKELDLYEITEILSEVVPKEHTLVTDSGFIEVIVPTNFLFKRGQRIIHPVSQGAMGFAIPAAIGAYYALNQPITVVVGDGSIMMNLQELQTIVHHNLPINIIIINNNVYGIIRRRQKDLFRRRLIGVDPQTGVSCPDFNKIANGFEIKYKRTENKSNLKKNLEEVYTSIEGPVIHEILARTDQEYIEISSVKTKNGKYTRRPLEDQYPFLDREKFLKEMIIQPIDQ